MTICRYTVKFVEIEELKPEERKRLTKRSCFGPPIGEEVSTLTAYIELEAESDTLLEEWMICSFCREPARILRILPFIAIHPLLWAVCEKCYAQRDALEKSIPLDSLRKLGRK